MREEKEPRPGRALRSGAFDVNCVARELRNDGVLLHLQPQLFRILSMLLDKPGELVTREEIRQRLWAPGTFVDFEHNVNSVIKKLRTALGDSGQTPRYVEIIPRVGSARSLWPVLT